MHDLTKFHSGFLPDTPDNVVSAYWEHFRKNVFKPCAALTWCPYGPLVEDFPLEEEELAEWECAKDSEPIRCRLFGHYCPVYFTAEPMLDPLGCETLPTSVAGCEDCPIDDCQRAEGEEPTQCGDPLCRSCFTRRVGAGASTLGCDPAIDPFTGL